MYDEILKRINQLVKQATKILCCNTAPTLGLRLLFDDIVNAPVADPSSVDEWNTFFDTVGYADTPFTQVTIEGGEVTLIGATNLIIKEQLFRIGDFDPADTTLLGVFDDAECVVEIEDAAFVKRAGLVDIVFPAVHTTGQSAFQLCTSIVKAHFLSLVNLGIGTFSNCTSLNDIYFPLVEVITYSSFQATALTEVNHTQFPLVTSMTGGLQFIGCSLLTSFTLDNITGDLGHSASGATFLNCTSLVSITVPGVTSVGPNCFQGCTLLEEVHLPLVTKLWNSIFTLGCPNVVIIDIPECTEVGADNLNNGVFNSILGNNVTLTIKASAVTDQDVVWLEANNTVTLITT